MQIRSKLPTRAKLNFPKNKTSIIFRVKNLFLQTQMLLLELLLELLLLLLLQH